MSRESFEFVLTFEIKRAHLPRTLRARSPSTHDLRQWAATRFAGERFEVELVKGQAGQAGQDRIDVSLEWVESDAGARLNRHLEVVEYLCFLCFGLPSPVIHCDGCGGTGWKSDGARKEGQRDDDAGS